MFVPERQKEKRHEEHRLRECLGRKKTRKEQMFSFTRGYVEGKDENERGEKENIKEREIKEKEDKKKEI